MYIHIYFLPCLEKNEMSAWIPFIIVTAFWAVIGAGGPFLVPSGVNRGLLFV
jgi:hypothetical protein